MARVGIDARKLGDTGVGRYAQSLLAGLGQSNHADAHTWTVYSHSHRWRHAERLPPLATRRTVRSGSYSPLQHLEFAARFARGPVDLFHATHFTTPLLVPRRTRLVVTIHDAAFLARPDLIPPEHRSPVRRALYRLLLGATAHRADVICADTTAAAQELERALPVIQGKLRLLSPAIDVDQFSALPATTTTQSIDDKATILFVGTITARKGVLDLISAFHQSLAHQDGLRLVLAGNADSDYGRQVATLAEQLGLGPNLHFTGPIPDAELLSLYSRARAVVLPSYIEGFGLPVVEAMAAGVPAIASDIPAIREVAAGAALLTPPGDIPALRAALDRACFDAPLRADLIARGHQRAAHFSLNRMGQTALALYQEILASLPRRHPAS